MILSQMARKKLKPIIDLGALHAIAKANVQQYYEMISELSFIIANHPEVNQNFIIDTVLNKYGVDEPWFSDMQEHHKQSIIDSVKGKK